MIDTVRDFILYLKLCNRTHLGVVPMRDGKLQGKNVFNRQELLWLQDKFPEHMKKQGFELKRGERGSDRKHIETAKFKKQTLEGSVAKF
ncbi:plasmid recombination protein [Enterococcus faecium]|uniref:plasmid recombination protein n=1 Tax=Enterococcus faecium TaxID=1352 RepID=UPI003F6BA7B4